MTYSLDAYRAKFEYQNQGCQLPFFYSDEVVNGLNKVAYSLDCMVHPVREAGGKEYQTYQKHRQDYVDNHFIWRMLPYRISLGNTYNVMPFASADFSTTNITHNHQPAEKKESKEKKEEKMSTLEKGALLAMGLFVLYKVADAIGQTIGELNAANQDLSHMATLERGLVNTTRQMSNVEIVDQAGIFKQELQAIQDIVKDEFLPQIRHNALQNLMLRVTVAVAALIVITGALVGSYTVVIPGVLMGILAGFGIWVKSSISKNDKTINETAQKLLTKIQKLVTSLNGVPHRTDRPAPGNYVNLVYFQKNLQQPQYPQYQQPNLYASAPQYTG